MDKLRLYLRYFEEKKSLFRAALIIAIIIIAALFFTLNGEEGDSSEELTANPVQQSEESTAGQQAETPAAEIYVDISGEVKNPGVYLVEEGTRLFQVIEQAGGLTEDASVEQINQAETVIDGQKILIPAKGEEQFLESTETPGKNAQGLININTADSTVLQELPGVGPVTAEKIIAYRTEHGSFKSPEDIKEVSGIGDATFEKLKDKITV